MTSKNGYKDRPQDRPTEWGKVRQLLIRYVHEDALLGRLAGDEKEND